MQNTNTSFAQTQLSQRKAILTHSTGILCYENTYDTYLSIGNLTYPNINTTFTRRWHGTEQLGMARYGTTIEYREVMWYRLVLKSNSRNQLQLLPEIKMDDLFTAFRAIEKRRSLRHRIKETIVVSRFSRNIHNGHPVHLKWPLYRSCCTPTETVYSLPVALVSILLPKSLSAVFFRPPRHFNTMETSYYACSLAIISPSTTVEPCRAGQQSCCNRAGSAQHGTVLTVFTRQILTEPYRAKPYRTVLARIDCVV